MSLGTLWNAIRRPRVDDDLREEMDTHLALIEEAERTRGMTADEARASARLKFGNPLVYRECAREAVMHDARARRWLGDAGQDVRYAIRTLRSSPSFAMVAVPILRHWQPGRTVRRLARRQGARRPTAGRRRRRGCPQRITRPRPESRHLHRLPTTAGPPAAVGRLAPAAGRDVDRVRVLCRSHAGRARVCRRRRSAGSCVRSIPTPASTR